MNLPIAPQPVPLIVNADGVVLITGTRVPLDSIVFEFRNGATAEAIAEQFSLELADIYSVISYYLRHQSTVENYLQQRYILAQKVRETNEQRFPSYGLRDRLLARRQHH